jgi:hypothetical protein
VILELALVATIVTTVLGGLYGADQIAQKAIPNDQPTRFVYWLEISVCIFIFETILISQWPIS